MKVSKFDQRIRRAGELAAAHAFAREILEFYKHLATLQKSLYSAHEETNRNGRAKRFLRLAGEHLDFEFLATKFPEFLPAVEASAPFPIAQSARELRAQPAGSWNERFSQLLFGERHSEVKAPDGEELLVLAFLQPCAEFFADHREPGNSAAATRVCPFCRSKPVVGVLRPEGDGGKRSLVCSLCFTEWAYGRIRCPACGEETVEKLAVYTAEQFPHVRLEACDTCRHYIKTVDLTKNGLAVPVVDELATIPLNLWAREHDYQKLQPNLLGI
jgi:FdhE protein